jgi:transcription antitermination factor NusG
MERWYVLRVRPRCEKSVVAAILRKGYEAFLPVQRCQRPWSDRFKSAEVPLFQGYVFCRLDASNRLPILIVPNVLHFVCAGKVPIVIADLEIAAIQAPLLAGVTVEPWPYVEGGQKVRLESGPLEGAEGILVDDSKRYRLVVSLPVLRQSLAIEIEHQWLRSSDANGTAVRAAAQS